MKDAFYIDARVNKGSKAGKYIRSGTQHDKCYLDEKTATDAAKEQCEVIKNKLGKEEYCSDRDGSEIRLYKKTKPGEDKPEPEVTWRAVFEGVNYPG